MVAANVAAAHTAALLVPLAGRQMRGGFVKM